MIEKLDYSAAGVDLKAADEAVARVGELAKTTYTDGVLAGVGPFSGLFRLDTAAYREPVLVSSCDGVGTKLKLAIRAGCHRTIGVDLVNHCINDILTCGARPLTFLDYIALGRLDSVLVAEVVEGIAEACRENGIALIGGETAEMPGIYRKGEYDVAGFINGIVERDAIVDGSQIRSGQAVIGLASTGPHTNGYSLIRKILFDQNQYELDDTPEELGGTTLGEAVLAPHRSYLHAVEGLLRTKLVTGMAHITGGGIAGNLVRILPEGVQAVVDTSLWTCPPIFTFLQRVGQIDPEEMYRVFNMGIGFVVVVEHDQAPQVVDTIVAGGVDASVIGNIAAGTHQVRLNTPA
ncbi:MAG TPA: phosphoribosylformylglycinamidine cyclo-ligase [Acidobacteriota bacterium]|nr:phosphoribosylformylglycinamidine cyclo-ligase [Acidobacteriota bacterium]